MNKGFSYLFLLAATTVLVSACRPGPGKLPSLIETYSKKDKKPFGSNIAYRQLEALYNENTIREINKSFKYTWQSINDSNALYICIAPELFVNETEVESMMGFVYAGNSLFISAGAIDKLLLDKISCKQKYTEPRYEKLVGLMKNTGVISAVKPTTGYDYYYYPFSNYFFGFDSSVTRVLGYNENRQANFIVYFYGSGKLYLQCEPRAFSNYFLLKNNNYEYLRNAVAFTPNEPQHVYWDDYYRKLKNRKNANKDFSTFSEIMKYPPLAYAFWLSLILLLLYVLFAGKRKQRIIEQLKSNENTTVTFTETIGRLYLQKKDNKNIADKMITYFNEYIRNTYFLNTSHVNDEFIVMLSRKSGVEKNKVDTLYRTIISTHKTDVVSDYQLLSLHEQIQKFYKNRN